MAVRSAFTNARSRPAGQQDTLRHGQVGEQLSDLDLEYREGRFRVVNHEAVAVALGAEKASATTGSHACLTARGTTRSTH
jgi:hypothetical protein